MTPRLGFIVKAFPRADDAPLVGGSAKAPYRLIKALARVVALHSVVAFEGAGRKAGPFPVTVIGAGPTKLYLKTLVQNLLSFPAILRMFRGSDVVQCHHPHYGLGAALLKAILFRSKPFVVKAHGTAVPELAANRYRGWKGFVLAANAWLHMHHDRFVLRQADVCLCSSDFQKSEMSAIYGLPAHKLATIYNGYDEEYFHPSGMFSDDKLVLVFCGRLVPKKGIPYALAVFRALRAHYPGAQLNLVLGHRNSVEDAATWRAVRAETAKDEAIAVHFDLSERQLARMFGSAHVGLISSKDYESIPSVLYEMRACGVTVFATREWGIPEVLGPQFALTGIVEADVARIRLRLEQGLDRLAVAASNSRHAYGALKNEYLALYTHLLGR